MINLKSNSEKARQGRQILLMLLFFLLAPLFMFGQKTVTGVVTSVDGEPLIGANVLIQGTNVGTITGIDGSYTLDNVPEDAVIVISFIGYDSQEISATGRNDIDVIVTAQGALLDELVVTGYGVERKKDLLGAVSVVDLDKQKDANRSNVMERLQGRVAGVTINLNDSPGQGAEVFIRGASTLGNNNPLYIVDGVPIQSYESLDQGSERRRSGLSWLNPNDIESIQVLKDASAATIYGSRANNGVIIITTKQPGAQKSGVTVRASYGVDNWGPSSYDASLNATGRATTLWQKAVNDGINPDATGFPYTFDWHFDPSLGPGIQGNGVPVLDQIHWPEYLSESPQMIRPAGHPQSVHKGTTLAEGTNWWEEINQTGIVQDYDVSFSSGGEKGGARLSLNYHDRKGVVKGTDFNRISLRLNSNYNLFNGKVTVGQNLAAIKEERLISPGTTQGGGSLINRGYQQNPIMPVFTEDGLFTGTPGAGFSLRTNPLADVDDNKDDRINDVKVLGNLYADWRIIEGLSFRTNVGIDYDNVFSRDIQRSYSRGAIARTFAQLDEIQTHRSNLVWNNTLTYSKAINNHTFTVLAGTEAVEFSARRFHASAREFALETNDYFQQDAASGSKSTSGNTTGFTLFSYFGKANYSFKDKYLASFTIRRDGSSRFGSANRFAVFPAVSVGWRIGSENFLSGVQWLSDLKIRAGWGQTGNQDILDNARFGLFEALYADANILRPWDVAANTGIPNATSYDIGNNNTGLLPSGFLATQTENQDLKWETQTELNVGIDFGFLDNRLAGSFEVYQKTTEDILIRPVSIDALGEGSSRWANGASMEVNGWEALVQYSQPAGDWQYSFGVNLSHFTDKITELPEGLFASYPGNQEQNILGRSPNSFFGYTTDGIFQTQAEVDAHATQPGKRLGQLRFRDLNGDGAIDALDQEYHGVNGRPKVQYGLNADISYRGFDLSVFFWGQAGRKIFDGIAIRREAGPVNLAEENWGVLNLNAWTTANTDTHIPAQSWDASNNRVSDYSWRNGGFLAFRQATLGYTIPWSGARDLRVYVSGENLFWITGGSGQDEWTAPGWKVENAGSTVGLGRADIYPKVPRYTLGMNVTF